MLKKPTLPLPCFLLEEKKLLRNLRILKSVQEKAGVQIILAFKAYGLWHSFPTIKKYLDGATASSLWEAQLCYEEMGSLAHTYSPAYLPEDIEQICERSSHLTVNSLSEYERFKAVFEGKKISIGLRVNPEYAVVSTDLYNPASPGSRLGVPASVLEKEGWPSGIEGLHFHTLCESSAEDLVKTLEVVEAKFGKYLFELSWINMGGGHLMTSKDYNLELLINTLRDFRKKYKLKIILEPGSAIAWQTGDLHARVLDIVNYQNIKTAVLDVSFTAHMPDTLEMPYRPEVASATENGRFRYRLGGVSCLAGDYLDNYKFEKPLEPGDVLILKDMMHYTMVKTTMFNGVRHPSICCRKSNGKIEEWRRFYYSDFKSRLG